MELIKEQEHVAVSLYLCDDLLHSFLELTAVFRSGYHPREIKSKKPFILYSRRNISGHYKLSKTLDYCSLTYTRLTNEAWIILCPSAEYLNDTGYFITPSDNRIELSLTRKFSKITAVLCK